jgi:hypothetical protein
MAARPSFSCGGHLKRERAALSSERTPSAAPNFDALRARLRRSIPRRTPRRWSIDLISSYLLDAVPPRAPSISSDPPTGDGGNLHAHPSPSSVGIIPDDRMTSWGRTWLHRVHMNSHRAWTLNPMGLSSSRSRSSSIACGLSAI